MYKLYVFCRKLVPSQQLVLEAKLIRCDTPPSKFVHYQPVPSSVDIRDPKTVLYVSFIIHLTVFHPVTNLRLPRLSVTEIFFCYLGRYATTMQIG